MSYESHDQIEKTLFRFMRAFDKQDWDALSDCLCDEIFCDYSSFRGISPGTFTKQQYVAERSNAFTRLKTQHNLFNIIVDIQAESARAQCNYVIYPFHFKMRDSQTHRLLVQSHRCRCVKHAVNPSMGARSRHPVAHGLPQLCNDGFGPKFRALLHKNVENPIKILILFSQGENNGDCIALKLSVIRVRKIFLCLPIVLKKFMLISIHKSVFRHLTGEFLQFLHNYNHHHTLALLLFGRTRAYLALDDAIATNFHVLFC